MAGGTPDPGSIIYLKDWLTLGALLLGPILAVWWTLNHQKRAEKRNAKERLFMTLMAHRKSPPNLEWATALNLIDVVYSNYPNIVALWHSMYEIASQGQAGGERWNHVHLSMLSKMATVLGYKGLEQTDIDKFYFPQAQADLDKRQQDVATEFLRALKASKNFSEGNDG
jgi:hypothetical protein